MNANNTQQAASGTAQPAGQAGQQSEDYGDKAFDFIAKKTGHPVNRNTSEKITDGVRGAFEKVTG